MTLTMDERLDREIKGWKPEKGDKLVGLVIDRVDGIEGGFEPYSLLTIETVAGELVNLHCFHSTLRTEVARRNPQPGDVFGVKYHGIKEGGKYGKFEAYTVLHERAKAPAPDVLQQVAEALRREPQVSRPVVVQDAAPVPNEADRPEDDEAV